MPASSCGVYSGIEHGGQLARIKRQFPNIKNWLDLSTGISPWSYPYCSPDGDILRGLPDEVLLGDTQAVAARAFGIAAESVLAGAGAQAFIRILPQAAERVLGCKPIVFIGACTYGEYARSAEIHNCEVRLLPPIHDLPDLPSFPGGALVILGNPNNPDGKFLSAAKAGQIAESLQGKGLLVIDEAFCDYYPQKSLASEVARHNNMVVLKSFGKFFGLAGLRLGFATAQATWLKSFADILGVWTVATPALAVAREAYADRLWIEAQQKRIAEQSQKLQDVLQAKAEPKREIISNSGLFITCRTERDLFTQLAQAGIYIRGFSAYENLYRLGLPADDEALKKLQAAL